MSRALIEWYRNLAPMQGQRVFNSIFHGGKSSFSFLQHPPVVFSGERPTTGVNFFSSEHAHISTNFENGWHQHDFPEYGLLVGPSQRKLTCDFSQNSKSVYTYHLNVDAAEAEGMVADLSPDNRDDYGHLEVEPVLDGWTARAFLFMSDKVIREEHTEPLFHDGFLASFVRNAYQLGRRTKAPTKRLERLAPKDLEMTLEYIDTHYGSSLTLEELAGLSNYSKYHFLRAFANTTGVSPYRYVMMRRVRRAVELLHKSDLPIQQIARVTGFADQAHLTRQVHRFSGKTPGRLRGERVAS